LASGLCEDCRHWEQMGNYPYGVCRLLKNEPLAPDSPHKAKPLEGHLLTARDFGCVQWASKKEKPS
jgi:hypothetical protein